MAEDMEIPLTPRSMSPVEEEDSDIELNYDAPTATAPEDAFFKNFQGSRLTKHIHELGVALNSRRKAAPDTIIGAATAWIDRDDSGNYDPDEDRVRPSRKAKRVRVAGSNNKNDAPKSRKKNRPPETLVLKFTEEKSLDYLRSITPDSETLDSGSTNELSDSSDSEDESSGGLRKTRKKNKPKRLGVIDEREDGLTLEDLSEGHPQRRGCKSCFLQGDDDCSLINHAFEYPCTACEDADEECELIVPPKLKKSCQACKRKRITCSYRDDGGKGVDTCKACDYDDEVCCAAPMKESSYSKRFDDADDVPAPPPVSKAATRMFVACCECREAGLRCSLKRGQDGPCKTCRETNEDCTFVFEGKNGALPPIKILKPSKPSISTSTTLSKQKRRRKRSPPPPLPTIETAAHSLSTPGTAWKVLGVDAEKEFKRSRRGIKEGKHKHKHHRHPSPTLTAQTLGLQHQIIKTCFAHPIKFNYVPDPANQHPCSWCSMPFFGLWGFGEVEVEVIPWGGTLGNEEIVGGWASDKGHASAKMCVPCTFNRVRIITCQGHRVRRIEGLDIRSFQPKMLEESFAALADGDKEGGKLAMETKWCNICVAVAEYKCCTRQHYSDSAEQVTSNEKLVGCGLYLCATCNDVFERIEKSKGNNPTVVVLDALVVVRRNELWKAESDKVRADAEFLTSRGELMVRMAQGMGVGDASGGNEVSKASGVGGVSEGGGRDGESGMLFGGAMDSMMKDICEKKSKKGKGKQKQKEMVFGGELTPTPTSTPRKSMPKVDVKGKGRAVEVGGSFGADSTWEAGTDAMAAKSWYDMWS